MRTLTITENDAGQRLDKFLQKALPLLPVPLMYKCIRLKKIKVNRKRAEQKYHLQAGDTVQLFLAEEFFEQVDADNTFLRITPHLQIVYEDDAVLIVNKPEGLIVHADRTEEVNTLINHIKAYLVQTGAYRPQDEQSFAPALCHRIDRNTCGLVIAAKTASALRAVNEMIRRNQIHKTYLCLTHGTYSENEKQRVLQGYLCKDSAQNLVTIRQTPPQTPAEREVWKKIVTSYRVLQSRGDIALVEIELLTGRTHQIRAHMAFAGHPLVGDGKYGVNRQDRTCGYVHQALCAYRLTFDPVAPDSPLAALSGKTVALSPDDIWFVRTFHGHQP